MTALFQVNVLGLSAASSATPRPARCTSCRSMPPMPDASPTELAVVVSLHQSSITRQVSLLEDAGFVTVAVNPRDRRSCRITLTEAGRAELARLYQIGVGRFADLRGGLGCGGGARFHPSAHEVRRLRKAAALVGHGRPGTGRAGRAGFTGVSRVSSLSTAQKASLARGSLKRGVRLRTRRGELLTQGVSND